MAQSYKILSVLGIDIELHFTFIIFIAALLFFNLQLGLLLLMVFVFVTAHELCHSAVAIRNKIKVKKIILLPIGGLAMMDATDIKPVTEIKISLAGPLFNFLMCGVFFLIMFLLNIPLAGMERVLELGLSLELFIYYAFYVNLVLGFFNLFLPAFPLDGGRIFRALLALKLDYVKATLIARNVSLVIAGFIAALAIMIGDLWIIIICAFIIFAALAEYQGLLIHTSLSKIKPSDVISKSYLVVRPRKKVIDVVEKMLDMGSMSAIVKYKTLVKVADIRSLSDYPVEERKNITFEKIAVKVPRASKRTSVEKITQAMSQLKVSMIPVYEKGRIIGVVKRVDVERARRVKELMG